MNVKGNYLAAQRKIKIAWIAYWIGVVITFGHAYNSVDPSGLQQVKAPIAAIWSLVFPLYWSAIIFKPDAE